MFGFTLVCVVVSNYCAYVCCLTVTLGLLMLFDVVIKVGLIILVGHVWVCFVYYYFEMFKICPDWLLL